VYGNVVNGIVRLDGIEFVPPETCRRRGPLAVASPASQET